MTNPDQPKNKQLPFAAAYAIGRLEGLAATTRFDTHEFHNLIRKEIKEISDQLSESLHHFDHPYSECHHKK